MKKRYIFRSLILVGIIMIGYLIYSIFYGSPIGKYYFEQKVSEYVSAQCKEEMVIQSIEYSFKLSTSLADQHFYAIVYSKYDPTQVIGIAEGYDGKLKSYITGNKGDEHRDVSGCA